MTDILFEVAVVFVLILLNGLFALSECAVVSARRTRLQQWAAEGRKGAQAALELSRAPTAFLSTVQVGITLIGIFAGAYGGQTFAAHLAGALARVDALAPYSQALAFGLVVAAITYFSLVLGELAPKRLALSNPEKLASLTAAPMQGLAKIAFPAVRVLEASTELIFKALGIKHAPESPVTEEEVKILIEQGTQAGVFEAAEKDLVYNVFGFTDRRVGALMTLRGDVVWLDVDQPMEENFRRVAQTHHSSFPVCKGSLENVLGMLPVKTLWSNHVAGNRDDLAAGLVKPLYVPQSMPALRLLEVFKQSRKHIALVVDEYGCIQGLVTLIDVLEALVGDLPVSGAPPDEMVLRRQDGSWLLDGLVPVDRLKGILKIRSLPGEEKGYFQTLGGFVMSYLGHIPRTGERFEWGGHRFEVVDMDGNRVDKVLLTPLGRAALPDPSKK